MKILNNIGRLTVAFVQNIIYTEYIRGSEMQIIELRLNDGQVYRDIVFDHIPKFSEIEVIKRSYEDSLNQTLSFKYIGLEKEELVRLKLDQ